MCNYPERYMYFTSWRVSISAQCAILRPITVVAQLVEQRIPNPQVGGSIPSDRVSSLAGSLHFLSSQPTANAACL